MKKLQKEVSLLKQRNRELEAGTGFSELESEKATLEAELQRQRGEVGQKDEQLDRLTTLILKAGVASPAPLSRTRRADGGGGGGRDRRLTWAPGVSRSRASRMSFVVGPDGFADVTADRETSHRRSLLIGGAQRATAPKRQAESPLKLRQPSRLAKGESGLPMPAPGLDHDTVVAALEKKVSKQQRQLAELNDMLETSNRNLERSMMAGAQLEEERRRASALEAEVEALRQDVAAAAAAKATAEAQRALLQAKTEEVAKLKADATFMNEEIAV